MYVYCIVYLTAESKRCKLIFLSYSKRDSVFLIISNAIYLSIFPKSKYVLPYALICGVEVRNPTSIIEWYGELSLTHSKVQGCRKNSRFRFNKFIPSVKSSVFNQKLCLRWNAYSINVNGRKGETLRKPEI